MDWKTKRKLDNVWGPIGTIAIHVIIVLVLLHTFVPTSRIVESEVEVVIREIESFEDLEDIEQELDELEDIPTVVEAIAPPTVSMDQEPPQMDTVTPGAVDDVDLSQFDMMEATSPLQFRGMYASRSSSGRDAALKEFGGGMGERTEFAVMKALRWLKDHQEPNGSWGPSYRIAMTSMALLAFLAHGETTASPEFGMAIRRGLRYLLEQQKGGWFIGGGDGIGVRNKVYEHAIGTYAISEAYGLTQIPFLRTAMEDAVQVIIDGQHEAGSWDYDYKMGPDAHIDVSLAGWHIQALKAAIISGAKNRGAQTALNAAIRGLKLASDMEKTGMFRYGTRENTRPDNIMTGVAVLSLQLAGSALDGEARAGARALGNMRFLWGGENRATGRWPIYAWYYITQARFHEGGRSWVNWNRDFAPSACVMQNPDGSWGPAPNSVEEEYGPVYSTSLMALMLQVYYRFLPTYKPIEIERAVPIEEQIKDREDEIIIEFG